MATQLQEIIGKLEQRVVDRTTDLESQTFRLRVAAEIARDAASARDLNELLTRAGDLILSRFGFYPIWIISFDTTSIFKLGKAASILSKMPPGSVRIFCRAEDSPITSNT